MSGKRKLTVEILGENAQLAKALAKSDKDLDAWGSKVNAQGEKLKSAGKKMTLGITVPLVAAGTVAFKLAADLQDSIGASEQIFGAAADDVKRWADKLPSYYGIAKGEAYEYTNIMGSLMKNLGGLSEAEAAKQSARLTELAGDLAAMYGGTTQTAVQALTGALKGNTAMLDNYGISATAASIKAKALEMGIADGTGALTDQQKQAALLTIIWEQTGNAQGQAAREADSASGQMRALTTEVKDAAAEMGGHLLPVGAKVLGFLADMVSGFGALPESAQVGVLAILGIAAAAGPVMTAVGNIMTTTVKLRQTFTTVGAEGERSLTRAGRAAKNLGLAVGVAGAAFAVWQLVKALDEATVNTVRLEAATNRLKSAGDSPRELAQAMQDVAGASEGWLDHFKDATTVMSGLDNSAVHIEGLRFEIDNLDAVLKKTKETGDADLMRRTIESIRGAKVEGEAARVAFDKFLPTLDDYEDWMLSAEEATAAEAAALKKSADEALGATGPTKAAGEAAGLAAVSHEDFAEAINKSVDGLRELQGTALDADQAERALADATRSLDASVGENGKTLNIHTEAGSKNRAALDAQVKAATDLATAQAKVDTSGQSSRRTLEGQALALLDLKNRGIIPTEAEYQRLLGVYGLTPSAINTRITADTRAAQTSAQDITRRLNSLPGVPAPLKAQIQSHLRNGEYWAAEEALNRLARQRTAEVMTRFWDPVGLQWRARGGPVDRGAPYIVGEEGEELFVPDQSGRIVNARETASILRGASGGTPVAGATGGASVQVLVDLRGSIITTDMERSVLETVERAVARGMRIPRLREAVLG